MKLKFFVVSVVLALALVACGGSGGGGGAEPTMELQFYNWSEYIDPDILDSFEAETGIRVVENTFGSNEEMLAKVAEGGSGYDLVVPSDYTVSIMIAEGLLAELDHANIPNLSNLRDDMVDVPFDPGNKYCVPYQWGTTGLGYNSAIIDEPTSWSILFEPQEGSDTYGRTTMLDDPREAFAAALAYLGYDINTTDEAQLEEAKQLLIQAKPGISAYDSEQYDDLLAAGESVMAHGWNGDVLVVVDENEDISFTMPQEGGVIWIDNICILSDIAPERKAAAEQFINYLLDAEIGAQLSEWNYYASPNAASEDILGEEFTGDPAVYPPADVRDKLQFIHDVGDFEAVYERMWEEVKAS